jgi:anthranilate synthase component 1
VSGFAREDPTPDRAAFREEARKYTVVPVSRELHADWWTPVSAFRVLAGKETGSFLLESVEGGERVGRFSFLGRRPFLTVSAREGRLLVRGDDAERHRNLDDLPPLAALRPLLGRYRAPVRPELPPFTSGAVGYLGYDAVRGLETLPDLGRSPAPEDDFTLLFLSETAAFDHTRRRLILTVNAPVSPGQDLDAAHAAAVARLAAMESQLRRAAVPPEPGAPSGRAGEPRASVTRDQFCASVRRAKERIAAGDVFQVVLSQRFRIPFAGGDLALYRALRAVNPSPYMFLLRFPEWSAVGSSPEPLLRVTGDRLSYRPIAGTAPRGAGEAEDRAQGEALVRDPKERAEHVMLVDLGRNDLGRCAVPGTVRVDELMVLERYSHVMHLVSGLSAQLRPDLSALDALFACFPAGTVSGAPKVRAMEIIEELETERRGLYGGAVGYLDFSGNLDTCIALRTMVLRDGEVRVQAGAGIVADSDPDQEYAETLSKAEALFTAVRMAPGFDGATG